MPKQKRVWVDIPKFLRQHPEDQRELAEFGRIAQPPHQGMALSAAQVEALPEDIEQDLESFAFRRPKRKLTEAQKDQLLAKRTVAAIRFLVKQGYVVRDRLDETWHPGNINEIGRHFFGGPAAQAQPKQKKQKRPQPAPARDIEPEMDEGLDLNPDNAPPPPAAAAPKTKRRTKTTQRRLSKVSLFPNMRAPPSPELQPEAPPQSGPLLPFSRYVENVRTQAERLNDEEMVAAMEDFLKRRSDNFSAVPWSPEDEIRFIELVRASLPRMDTEEVKAMPQNTNVLFGFEPWAVDLRNAFLTAKGAAPGDPAAANAKATQSVQQAERKAYDLLTGPNEAPAAPAAAAAPSQPKPRKLHPPPSIKSKNYVRPKPKPKSKKELAREESERLGAIFDAHYGIGAPQASAADVAKVAEMARKEHARRPKPKSKRSQMTMATSPAAELALAREMFPNMTPQASLAAFRRFKVSGSGGM